MRRIVPLLLLACGLLACGADSPEERRRAAVKELEARVLAPCCWMGTIDVHESPIAHALRDEVTARIAAGEAPEKILDDLVERYGPRVRATPPGGGLPLWLYLGGALAFAIAGLVAYRWVRRGRARTVAAPSPRAVSSEDEDLESQLDDELSRLD